MMAVVLESRFIVKELLFYIIDDKITYLKLMLFYRFQITFMKLPVKEKCV